MDAVVAGLAAYVLSGCLSSWPGVRRLLRPLSAWRVQPIWYLAALGLWPALVVAANAIAIKHGNSTCYGPLVGAFPVCDCSVPTQAATWGQLKFYYR